MPNHNMDNSIMMSMCNVECVMLSVEWQSNKSNGKALEAGMGNIKSYCIGAKCIKYAKFFMS